MSATGLTPKSACATGKSALPSTTGKPNIGQHGSWAVIIQTHSEQTERLGPAAKALAGALDDEGFIAAAAGKPPEAIPNTDTLHIIAGKKIDPALK